MDRYKLDRRRAVPCPDLLEWARWLETADRAVARAKIGPLTVSTVFLGLDHAFGGGPPLLFETMIFDGGDDAYQVRTSTWNEALATHAVAVRLARRRLARAKTLLES